MRFKKLISRLLGEQQIGLALSGGGCKAFFGLGVGSVLLEAGIPIKKIAGTSAGSAMALTLITGSVEQVVRYFYAITLRNNANFHWKEILLGRRPFPHERIYRHTVSTYIDAEKIFNSKIDIAINALLVPPQYYPPENRYMRYRLVAKLMLALRQEIKNAEKGIFRNVLADAAREARLEEVVFSKNDLSTDQMIENVVLASSSVPPMVSFQRLEDGNYYLDGGIFNNLPVRHLGDMDIIIAVYYDEMTRHLLEQSGDEDGKTIVYVRPDEELPITTWDYANPGGVVRSYEMGRRMGVKTLQVLKNIM